MRRFRIVEFTRLYELQEWNPVYNKWYCVKSASKIEYIQSYCLLNNIQFSGIPIVKNQTSGE